MLLIVEIIIFFSVTDIYLRIEISPLHPRLIIVLESEKIKKNLLLKNKTYK